MQEKVKNCQLVDDDTIFELVLIALRSAEATPKQFILFDGFPRTLSQAQWLDKKLTISKVISVRTEDKEVEARLLKLGQSSETIQTNLKNWRNQ